MRDLCMLYTVDWSGTKTVADIDTDSITANNLSGRINTDDLEQP